MIPVPVVVGKNTKGVVEVKLNGLCAKIDELENKFDNLRDLL